MADASDDDANAATTAKTDQQQQQQQGKKKRKRAKNRNKKTPQQPATDTESASTSQTVSQSQSSTSSPVKKEKQKQTEKQKQKQKQKADAEQDAWNTDSGDDDDDDDDDDKPRTTTTTTTNKNASKLGSPATPAPASAPTQKAATKTRTQDMDDDDEDDEDDDAAANDKKLGKYPIWRPEQNYQFERAEFNCEPNFVQRDNLLFKLKRKQTFEDRMRAFELKHMPSGLNFDACSVELLEVYGVNIYNHFTPIYENIGEDNHRPFMFDFDSLLLDLFHSPLISSQLKYGPRLLPLIDMLESYLDLLFGGGRAVQLIIFECNASLWRHSVHLYLRHFLRYYVVSYWQRQQQRKYDIAYPLVFEFDSFWGAGFCEYIYQYLPVFALMARPDFSPFVVDANRYLFVYQALYLSALKIPCVQCSELSFNSNALYGFSIDIPHSIERFILSRFRLTSSSSNAIQLRPLKSPETPAYASALPVLHIPTLTNLNCIELVANDAASTGNKLNIRRLSTVYALVAFLRETELSPSQWDFVRLVLLQLVMLEGDASEYRTECLPKLDAENAMVNGVEKTSAAKPDLTAAAAAAAAAKKSTWLDLEDDDDEDLGEESDEEEVEEKEAKKNGDKKGDKNGDAKQAEEDDEDEEEEEEEEEEEDDGRKEYDLEALIRECWWSQIACLRRDLHAFMMHCVAFLSHYLADDHTAKAGKASEVEHEDDLFASAHFDRAAFSDCFDSRILCYLLTVHDQFSGDKKNKNKRLRWLQSEKTVMSNLQLSAEQLGELQKLYAIVTDDVDSAATPALFPIIQSDELADVQFKRGEVDDYNRSIAITDEIKDGFVQIDGDIVHVLMDETEKELQQKGLLYATKKISGKRERHEFYKRYEWVQGGVIGDGIKEYEYEHRSYMRFQTFMQKYAQSLEGGKIVLRDVIVSKKKETKTEDTDGAAEDKNDKNKKKTQKQYKHGGKKAGSGGGGGKNKAPVRDVRLEAAKEVRAKERREKLEKVDNLIKICLAMYKDLEARIERLDEELQETNDPIAALPGLSKLHEWATEAALQCDLERNMYPIVRLWQVTFDIFRRFIENVNENVDESDDADDDAESLLPDVELVKNLQKSLHCMGFEKPARRIAQIYVSKKRGGVALQDVLVPFDRDNIRISIGTSYSRFQMEHCGPYMIRGVGSRPDPRVSGFYPDEWQVKLLDIVDFRYSALVVAPTSSGKTFVSYYCMKEILQQNKSIKNNRDKGLVVYVSPTKALTWQACADIYSKYGDVFGVLTPDYDHRPLECQVLVCVPESFEKLLMSPQRAQMHRQIKYVIFDEIHCLGRSEGGAIWERLLMLIRSPFLALSATVGHPLRLKKWLNTISNVMQLRTDEYKHKVKIIQHKERWSYLEKYIYLPDKQEVARATSSDGDDRELYIGCNAERIGWRSSIIKMHPVAAIGLTQNNNILDVYQGFPPLTFSPSDCVVLYDAMSKYVEELQSDVYDYRQKLQSLKPDLFFADNLYITKNKASDYEKLLKKQLKAWIVGYNQKSQIIDQDIFDIKQGEVGDDDADEKLADAESTAEQEADSQMDEKTLQGMSKKERKKWEQKQKTVEREKQRKEAEQRRQQQLDAKKRKKGGQTTTNQITKKVAEQTQNTNVEQTRNKARTTEDGKEEEKEEILTVQQKKERRVVMDKLLQSMALHVLDRLSRTENTFGHGIESETDIYSFQWVLDNFINLVIELQSSDRLPTLTFCLDRVECEQLFLRLLSDLEFLEQRMKQQEMGKHSNSEMEIEQRRRLKKLEKERRRLQKERERKERTQKKDEENPEVHDGMDDMALFDDGSDRRDYRFTLFDRGEEMDSDEMGYWTHRLLKKTKWSPNHPLMKGLQRGIGLHHEGLPIQYRHLVETLFRAKMIKLVVSVASLAMGVNMPARSVVFAGDNQELDPLNYRQMMGRAGRRGYDDIGHVIFFGISPRKISYLMTSQLTSLNGHYPILSTTSSIRCAQLLSTSMASDDVDDKYYIGMVRNLFHKPFNFKVGRKQLCTEDIMRKFRYSLELHVQNGLLSVDNLRIDGMGTLVGMLHDYEPNNLLFAKVMQSGYLHRLCQGYTKLPGDYNSKKKKDILLKLLLILCEIFDVHPVPTSYRPPKAEKYYSKSYLVLPERSKLEHEICEMIDKYRYNFLSHFYNLYYKQFADERVEQIYGKENLMHYIEYYLKYFNGGIFGHNQVFLKDFRGRNLRKNAYVYDFYIHGDYERIVSEACLRDGLAWRMLKRFQLLLSMIKSSLKEISSLKTKQDESNEVVKEEIKKFEAGLTKIRQHKFSIYRHQQQFWMDADGKLWKAKEIEAFKDNLKFQAIGDDFVMAFQDLSSTFYDKFRHIVPIGPISNYGDVAAADPTTTTTNNNSVVTETQPSTAEPSLAKETNTATSTTTTTTTTN